jgi:hypothetical protein
MTYEIKNEVQRTTEYCMQYSLITDLRFTRPKIRRRKGRNVGLMKMLSKAPSAHFAFCNN